MTYVNSNLAPARRAVRQSILALSVLSAVAVNAQEPALEEVVVTAQKRAESLQDVPISVVAMSGERLRDLQITNLEELTTFIPNFSMNQTGISNNITIRGVSSGINSGFEQSVGMYVDEVYYGRGQLARAPLFDLSSVEVLRGPQPIIFGKNSIAGAVNIVTAKPTSEFEGFITALYETEEETQDLRFALSGPLTDTLSGRLSGLYRDSEGSFYNTLTGDNDKAREETVIRAQLRWEPADALSINLKVERSEFDDRGRNVDIANSIVREDLAGIGGVDHITALDSLVATANNILGFEPPVIYDGIDGEINRVRSSNVDFHTNEVDVAVLDIDWDLGGFTLSSVTSFLDYEYTQHFDVDMTSASIADLISDEQFEQFSQEIRLTSPAGETVDYVVGAYFQTNELYFTDFLATGDNTLFRILNAGYADINSSRVLEQESDSWSLFAQLTWNISDRTRLIVGGRYTDEDKTGSKSQQHGVGRKGDAAPLPPTDPNGNVPNVFWGLNPLLGAFNIEPYDTVRGDRSESQFAPQITVQHDLSADTMIYATYAEGFKAGGFDARSNAHPDPAVVNAARLNFGDTPPSVAQDLVGVFEFEDERAESYEVGIKTAIGQTAEVNVAAYFTEYSDLQTSQFDGVLGFNVTNAGKAEIKGLEADARWLFAEGWTASANFAYLDFEYTDFPNSQTYFGMAADVFGEANLVNPDGVTYDASGKRREYTPEFTGSVSIEWVLPLGEMQLRTVYFANYSDSYIWNATLDPRSVQDSFVTHDLRIGLGPSDGNWEIAFIGRNLSDEDIVSFGGNTPLAGAFTQGTGTSYYHFLNSPATYAVQGTYRF